VHLTLINYLRAAPRVVFERVKKAGRDGQNRREGREREHVKYTRLSAGSIALAVSRA
jgi:hypothetical protein